MWQAVRFWLDMGVDGFRLDAIGTIYEDSALPDHEAEISMAEMFQREMEAMQNESDPEDGASLEKQFKLLHKYQIDQPGIHELLQELRTLIDEYDNRVLVGEVDEIAYYGDGANELHMIFNFPLMRPGRLTPALIRKNQNERLSALPPAAWPCNTLNNHDSSRVYGHCGDGVHNTQIARLSPALMLTLKGTPFLYNGEEIGMSDFMLPNIELFRDNLGVWIYHATIQNFDTAPEAALKIVQNITRDKCRTPMQWENAPNAGFSPAGVPTWLPINPNYAEGINVAEQQNDPESLLTFYTQILSVRKSTPALIEGDYAPLHEESESYFAFLRSNSEQCCLVVLNYSEQPQTLKFDLKASSGTLLFSSASRTGDLDLARLAIAPFEILIAEV